MMPFAQKEKERGSNATSAEEIDTLQRIALRPRSAEKDGRKGASKVVKDMEKVSEKIGLSRSRTTNLVGRELEAPCGL